MNRRGSALLVPVLLGAFLVQCGDSSSLSQSSQPITTNGVTATLNLQSDWGSGYCANLVLTNGGSAAVSSWTLVANLNQSTLTQVWSGSYTLSGSTLTMKPLSWNASIAPGTSVSLGFCGSATGTNYRPTLTSLSVTGGGGATDAGTIDAGTDGGTVDGGTTDGGRDGGTDGGTIDGGTTDGGTADGGASDGGTVGTVSCAGAPVWNSAVTYSTAGQLVEYNCKLYKNQGYAFNVNPETNNGQYYQWLLVGKCSETNCAMGEGPWSACGSWDKWTSGAYTIYNDVWGSGAGSQCITAWNGSHFEVTSTQPATSGVKSYPNSGFLNLNRTIGSLATFTSNFNVTVPSSGDWEAAYDIWVPTEIMIWMYTQGNVGPIAAAWDSTGKPIPSASNVTVGGHTWNVFHQNGGSNVISFVRTTNTTSGTVDVKALLSWAMSQGWIPNGTIGAVQFGFEITGTNNTAMKFTCNSFSITAN